MNVQINWASLSEETLEDRRDGKRVCLQFVLEVCGTDSSGARFAVQGRTRNVSHHGCCFEVARSIAKGEKLSLKVIRHNGSGAQETTEALPFSLAWVVKEEGLWVAGAEMLKVEAPWGLSFPEKPAAAKV
jgi:PilZ domain